MGLKRTQRRLPERNFQIVLKRQRKDGANKKDVPVVVIVDEQLPPMRRDDFSRIPLKVVNISNGMSDERLGGMIRKRADKNPHVMYLVVTLDGGFKRRAGIWRCSNVHCYNIWEYPYVVEQSLRGRRKKRKKVHNLAHATGKHKKSAIRSIFAIFMSEVYDKQESKPG